MEEISKEVTTQKKGTNWYFSFSLVLFVILIGLSGALYIANEDLSKNIENNYISIEMYSKEIDTLKNSNEIAAFDIINSNKNDIENNIERSRSSIYINEFLSISKKYKMHFTGFTFDGSGIKTEAVYNNKDLNTDAVFGISRFIRDFRTGTGGLLSLDPVGSVTGDSESRAFSVGFRTFKR